jgi:hypothetical protein
MKRALLIPLLLLAALAPAAAAQDAPPVQNEELRREIMRMIQEDQAAREHFGEGGKAPTLAEANALRDSDMSRAARLMEIVKRYGFPSAALVGREAARSFVTMLTHSPSLELQKKALPHVRRAVRRGDIPVRDYAMLFDDLLDHEGKPQLYGTNFTLVNGRLALAKTQDPTRLDERRRKLGLTPIREYAAGLSKEVGIPLDESSLPAPRK